MDIWQRQIIRYILVGVLSTSAYIAIALLLLYVFDMSLLAANICAFFVPMAISYFGNALWSFEAKGEFSFYDAAMLRIETANDAFCAEERRGQTLEACSVPP